MSIHVSEKLKLMRESERLNRREVSDLTGVPYSSLSSYESRSKNAGV
ncbi:helix-turn-helix domain-containing protein, partial [Escherichia coli]